MIEQGCQTCERRPVGDPRLDRVEMRPLKASNQVGVAAHPHVVMVAEASGSTEVKPERFAGSIAVESFDLAAAIILALARAGLSQKQACAHMVLDQGLWSRQLQGDGHVSLQRLLRLPVAFWCEFLPLLAEPAGLAVSHDDIADIALKQAAVAFDALARSIVQMRRRTA